MPQGLTDPCPVFAQLERREGARNLGSSGRIPRIAEVAGGEAAQVEDQQDLRDLRGGARLVAKWWRPSDNTVTTHLFRASRIPCPAPVAGKAEFKESCPTERVASSSASSCRRRFGRAPLSWSELVLAAVRPNVLSDGVSNRFAHWRLGFVSSGANPWPLRRPTPPPSRRVANPLSCARHCFRSSTGQVPFTCDAAPLFSERTDWYGGVAPWGNRWATLRFLLRIPRETSDELPEQESGERS